MKKILYIILCLSLCSVIPAVGQTRIFVSNGSGNDSNDGSSWGSAKKTIAAGIDAAGSNGIVYVKVGNYSISSQHNLSNGVQVKGGYKTISTGTDTTQRNLPNSNEYWANEDYCTIINGAGNHRIASVGNGCLLEGCVMNHGFTNTMGAGVLIDGGTVRYCVIKECNAVNENTFDAEGGGAYMRNGGLLSNSVITLCRGDIGPAVAGGNASLINNTITRNWPTHCGTVRDYDGNLYQTVVIGNQCWMRSNLRTLHYADGTGLAFGISGSATVPYYYVDQNYVGINIGNLPLYGYLYNWAAVMRGQPSSNANPSGVQGLCPNGWHLPSSAEWEELRNFVRSRGVYLCEGNANNIAKALSNSQGWAINTSSCVIGNTPSGNNFTYFGVAPAGCWVGYYENFGHKAILWTSTEANSNGANDVHFNYDSPEMLTGSNAKTNALSVRCLKDIPSDDNGSN